MTCDDFDLQYYVFWYISVRYIYITRIIRKIIIGQHTLNKCMCNSIQINHQPDATNFQFIILTFIYSSTCFGRFPTHHQEPNDCSGSLWFYLRIVVIVVRPARPRTQHDCHHDKQTVNKRQDNKLENCCIWLVIYLNCTIVHGLTNLKKCMCVAKLMFPQKVYVCSKVNVPTKSVCVLQS
jgi:hypothetical protein